MTQDIAVHVSHVSKRFRLFRERNISFKSAIMRRKISEYKEYWALKDVTFDIPKGQTFGLIGRNGSGKSTLLKCLAKIYYPDGGSIIANGRVASMLEIGSGFHPELSGLENIYLNAAFVGLTKKQVNEKLDEIIEFAELGDYLYQPVKNYSSGMYVRLGFSVAIHVDPEILVVDEVLAVGDSAFRKKCQNKFTELHNLGVTIIMVSHSSSLVKALCQTGAWIENGRLMKVGEIHEVLNDYEEFMNNK